MEDALLKKEEGITPFVSVIIPVYNDAERLTQCLTALEQQTYPKQCYEVIVVDNGSDESIEAIASRFDRVRMEYEGQQGSYAARNRGVRVARGNIFAFTDADCIPLADWIEEGTKQLQRTPRCGIVGGKIELFFHHPGKLNAVELHQKLNAFRQEHYIKNGHYSATANLFTRRDVFDRVGLFDGMLKSGGDYEWGRRVYEAGYELIFSPEAGVRHPARRTVADLFKKEERVVRGQFNVRDKRKSAFGKIVRSVRLMKPPIDFAAKMVRDDRLSSSTDMIKVCAVELTLRAIRVLTYVRLAFGRQQS